MKLFKKILLWFLGVFLTLVVLIYATFYFFQDTIKDKIVEAVNSSINGEIKVDNVGLALFSNFPNAVIKLKGFSLVETDSNNVDSKPIIIVRSLGAFIHISDAIKGVYTIGEVSLDGGDLYVVSNVDSTLNILNAIGSSEGDTTTNSETNISLHLQKLTIEDVGLIYEDKLTNQLVVSSLNSLESRIRLEGDSLSGNISIDFKLDSMLMEGKRYLNTHTLLLSTKFVSDIDKLSVRISDGLVKLDLLEANLEGFYNQQNSGYVDMHLSAHHKDLSELAKMEMLNPDYLPDVRKGSLALDVRITGKTMDKLPVAEGEIYLRDMEVHNAFGKVVDKAKVNAQFYSGTKEDMSDGTATFDSLEVAFASGGYVRASGAVENFAYPNFNVRWQATETLDDLYRIFRFDEVKKMNGRMKSSANLSGKYNINKNELVNPKGSVTAQFTDCNVYLKEGDYQVENLNGVVYVMEGDAGINGLRVNANGNDISMSARINQLVPYVLGKPTQLDAVLSLQSNRLNTSKLLAFDKELAKSTQYNIDSLDVTLMADLSSRDLDNYELVPSGSLEIQNLTAFVEGMPKLRKFSSTIAISKDTLSVKSLKGYVGTSGVDLSLAVTNYASFLDSMVVKPMDISIGLASDKIIARDVFTINDEFLLPKEYRKEEINDITFDAKLITTNKELQKTELLPEFEFQLMGLQLQTEYAPVKFKDISVFGQIKDNNVYINALFGKFGRSDVFLNAEFDNALATQDTISRPLTSRISFNSGILDVDELLTMDNGVAPDTIVADTTAAVNPFAADFPILDLNVNIGELTIYGEVIHSLSGIIKIQENNIVELNHVKLESGEYGSFDFDGTLDASSHEEAVLKANIKVVDVDLSNLDVSYVQDGENVRIGDHFAGVFNGEIVADMPIDKDFNFDINRLTGKMKAKITDGALINYAPLKEMGKYFKNKDLDNVRFDVLKNTMVFNSGKMLLPFMTINTTIGTINIMGFQTMDYRMSYDIQVPLKLVAGAALNSLFASKKEDDSKEDKIKKAKGKYVTVHISGNLDHYDFKLGKKHVLTPPPGFEVD